MKPFFNYINSESAIHTRLGSTIKIVLIKFVYTVLRISKTKFIQKLNYPIRSDLLYAIYVRRLQFRNFLLILIT